MLARVIGLVVLVIVLYAVITQPEESAATTRDGASMLGEAGSSFVVFTRDLMGGWSGRTASSSSDSSSSSSGSSSSSSGTDGSSGSGSHSGSDSDSGSDSSRFPIGAPDTGGGPGSTR